MLITVDNFAIVHRTVPAGGNILNEC
jgi:hypothetical protein